MVPKKSHNSSKIKPKSTRTLGYNSTPQLQLPETFEMRDMHLAYAAAQVISLHMLLLRLSPTNSQPFK